MFKQVTFAYEWDPDFLPVFSTGKKMSLSNACVLEDYLRHRESNRDVSFYEQYAEVYNSYRYTFTNIKDLPLGKKYIYNIPIVNFNEYYLSKCKNGLVIDQRVLSDARSGNALIQFYYPNEGYLAQDNRKHAILINQIAGLDVPANNVLFIHGDYNLASNTDTKYYTYYPMDFFSITQPVRSKKIIEYIPEKLFVSYNRKVNNRFHRILLRLYLHQYGLLMDGICSFAKLDNVDWHMEQLKSIDSDLNISKLADLISRSELDVNLESLTPGTSINLEHHRRTFVSLVSETFSTLGCDFRTEKTYKPILIGHPFIMLGSPYQLKRLKQDGFQTFDRWWDESYDDTLNLSQRILKIISILKTLKSLTDSQRIIMRKDMESVLVHNMNHFYSHRSAQDKHYTDLLLQHCG